MMEQLPFNWLAKAAVSVLFKWFDNVMKKIKIPTNRGFAPNYPSAKKSKFN